MLNGNNQRDSVKDQHKQKSTKVKLLKYTISLPIVSAQKKPFAQIGDEGQSEKVNKTLGPAGAAQESHCISVKAKSNGSVSATDGVDAVLRSLPVHMTNVKLK